MESKFSQVIDGVEFQFIIMNVKKIQLFQVYAAFEGKIRRFHLQLDERRNEFYIADEANCPPTYRQLVPELTAAIYAHCKE